MAIVYGPLEGPRVVHDVAIESPPYNVDGATVEIETVGASTVTPTFEL